MVAAALLALAVGEPPGQRYLELVERYRRGDRDGAVAAPFPPDTALRDLGRYDVFPFEAAVLLHSDRGFMRLLYDDPDARTELQVARRLVELMPEDRRRAFEPRWRRGAALMMSKQGKWDVALELLDEALQRYRGDPLMLLARGAALESRSRLLLGREGAPESWSRRRVFSGTVPSGAARGGLDEAEKSYRQALAVRPGLLHARLRLARALQLQGRAEASLPELKAVIAAATQAPDRYLAHLFLGFAREDGQRFDEAAAAYEEALRVLPDGQAAAVASSHALHRSGLGPESAAALRAGVDRAKPRDTLDPWWSYVAGQTEDAEALMDGLRAEAAR